MLKTPRTLRPVDKRIRTLALLGGLLILATAFAGCTNAQATASQLQVTAQERAQRWDADAQLVMILGTEGTFQMQSMLSAFGMDNLDSEGMDDALDEEFWQRVQDDPEPGDGRTEFWLYVFRAGDGESHMVVVVDKDKKVIYDETAEGSDLGVAVEEYNIDSNQAVQIALDENEHLKTASGQDQFGFVIGLFRESPEENPTWIVAGGGGTAEEAGGGMVMIDAANGEVLESEGGSGAPSDWTRGGF